MKRVVKIYDNGWRTAILSDPGRKLSRATIMTGDGLSTIRVLNKDAEILEDAMLGDKPYPLRRAQKLYRAHAARAGGNITKHARAALKRTTTAERTEALL